MSGKSKEVKSNANKNEYLTENGKYFDHEKLISSCQWFNLETNRKISNPPNLLAFKGLRVCGTEEKLNKFFELNKVALRERVGKKPTKYVPCQDVLCLCQEAYLKTRNEPTYSFFNKEVSELSQEEIETIPQFQFPVTFLKVRVLEVVDGDTLNVVGNLNGLFRFTIRTYGYDAAEKNTEQGVLAKAVLSKKVIHLNNILWCQTLSYKDRYGRVIAILYEDQERKKLLVECLMNLKTKVINPYSGGTKIVFS
jgi:hypothetical protein